MNQRISLKFGLLAASIDIATWLVAFYILPLLSSRFQTLSGWNALIVGGAFLLFIIGVYLFRRMKPMPHGAAEWSTRGWRAALALFFAFVISLALAWQLGFFASSPLVDTTQMGEGGTASYFVFGPGAWLAFSLIYVLVFAFNVEATIESDSGGYLVAAVFGLLATAVMLLVLTAQAQVVTSALEAGWWGLLAFPILVLLFLPPRLLYLSRTTGLRTPVSYGVIAILTLALAGLAFQIIG